MEIQSHVSLKKFNTFGIDVTAKRFISVNYVRELQSVLRREQDVFLLSGGSNMLLTKDIDSLVIHLNIKGIKVTEDWKYVYVNAAAGENWHDFVMWCIGMNYGGLENLSLIPGNVGTSPIQNIGAYGVEVKDLITKVEGIEIETAQPVSYTNEECQFGYRNSIFKNELKGKVALTSVTFRLTKNRHQLNTSYGAIETELIAQNIKKPTIRDVSNAVIKIRQSKLPDPKQIGNSGSFFKNPVISKEQFDALKVKYPDMPFYEVRPFDNAQGNIDYKVPAGWLIEQAGFKGKRYGDYGVHEKQALVLVNYGNASGKDIYELAQKIQQTILETFGISLEIEVNVIK
jgi:UDP-N-acetylmuramate dehydrogenase